MLLHQAIMEGRIDCHSARLLDRDWWAKVEWATQYVASQNRIRMSEYAHTLHVRLLDYRSGPDNFDLHWKQALDAQAVVRKELFPWIEEEITQDVADEMTEQYKALVGDDPNTPEGQASIEQKAANLRKMRENVGDPVPTRAMVKRKVADVRTSKRLRK